MMDYGEAVLLNLALKNVGIEIATNVSVVLSTDDPYITFTDNAEVYGDIDPSEVLEMTNAFAFNVANNIPDGHDVLIYVEATGNTDVAWSSSFSIEGHATFLGTGEIVINDAAGNSNGRIDAGETVEIILDVENSGSSEALNVIGSLASQNPFLTINSSQVVLGNLAGGEVFSAIFVATANVSTPLGLLVDMNFEIEGNLDISVAGMFEVVIGRLPVLILNLDPNNSSGPEMEATLLGMDMTCEMATEIPANINLYASVFCCLGVYPNNHILSTNEGLALAGYMENGGCLYMEGGDTWFYDDQTVAHNMFNIVGVADGSSNLGTVAGQSDTFTEGMSFIYSGENSFIDQILPISPAVTIFKNPSPDYGTGVAYDAGTYKTIGTSYEFVGLDDGTSPSTKAELMLKYLEFFDVTAGSSLQSIFYAETTDICEGETISFNDFSTGDITEWNWTFEGGSPGTSSSQNPTIMYNAAGSYSVTLEVSSGSENASTTFEGYIKIHVAPGLAATPTGETMICTNELFGPVEYTTSGATNADSYLWELLPVEAGTISGDDMTASVEWTENWIGTATIKVKGNSDVCGEGGFSNELIVQCDICSAIGNNKLKNSLRVFPNPTTGQFTVEFNHEAGQTEIQVLNILGEIVFLRNLDVTADSKLNIDLSDLNNGIYFARIKSGHTELIRKIIVK
jgi:PKD repeat protein